MKKQALFKPSIFPGRDIGWAVLLFFMVLPFGIPVVTAVRPAARLGITYGDELPLFKRIIDF